MQFSNTLIALVAAGVVSAQGIPPVPSCSLNCFTTALTTDGCSGLTDFECHCGKPQLVEQVTPCVEKACPPADQSSVSDVVVSVCSEAGVPIEVPQPGGGDGETPEPTSEPTEPEPTTAPTEPEPTEEPTEEPPTYPTESSSAPPESSSAYPTPSGSTTPSGSAPPAPTFTGAASKNSVGGVAALAMAAAYYL